jgi:phage baseplate assembly protein V
MDSSQLLAQMSHLEYEMRILKSKVANLFSTGVSTLPTNESGGTATIQVKHNPYVTHSDINIGQQFGFCSSPPVGSSLLTLAVGGDHSRKVVFGTHNEGLRPTGTPTGGTVIYDAGGTTISLTADGNATIKLNGTFAIEIGGATIFQVNSGGVEVGGTLSVSSTINAVGNIKGEGISLFSHVHGGVMAGGADTSPPVA